MVLEQDLAQYNQSARIEAERQYQRELAQYQKDEEGYRKEKNVLMH